MRGKVLVCVLCCLLLTMFSAAAAPPEESAPGKEEAVAAGGPGIPFAIAFEGGPGREITPKVLEVMNRYGARATFFPAGKNLSLYPELIRRIVAGGSEIGTHIPGQTGWDEVVFTAYYEIAPAALLGDLAGAPRYQGQLLSRDDNYIYVRQTSEISVATVYWLIDSRDLNDLSAAAIAERALAGIKPGAVVVLHDGEGSRQTVIDALEIILREANAHGYRSVTLSELEGAVRRDYFSFRSKAWLNSDQAEVRNIQARLEELGYDCGGVDGILGANTERAIRQMTQGAKPAMATPKKAVRLSGPEIRINIPEYSLTLLENGRVVKKYDIAVGTPYEQTPTGNFTIFTKIENPTWYPGSNFTDRTPVAPGPDNPLGTRWMEFSPAYGIHGTNKDWDISYPVSGGCIRMHDMEARELYEIVPVGTPVTVVYETMRLIVKPDGLYLRILPDIYNKQTSTPERLSELYRPYEAEGYKMIRPVTLPPKERDESYEWKIGTKPGV